MLCREERKREEREKERIFTSGSVAESVSAQTIVIVVVAVVLVDETGNTGYVPVSGVVVVVVVVTAPVLVVGSVVEVTAPSFAAT